MQRFKAVGIDISTERMEEIALILINRKIEEGLLNSDDIFGYGQDQSEEDKRSKALAFYERTITIRSIDSQEICRAIISGEVGEARKFLEVIFRKQLDMIFL